QRVSAYPIVIRDNRNRSVGAPVDLSANPRPVIEPAIGLPSVDEPRLNLQFRCREDLYPHPIEKPWRVRGNIRRLIGPVVEIVVTEEADVRHENSCVNVDSMQRVEVVSTVRFGQVPIGVVQVPLATRGTSVISRGRL